MALHAQDESPPFDYAYGYGLPDYSQTMFVHEGVNDMMFMPQSLGIAPQVMEPPNSQLAMPVSSQFIVPNGQEQEKERIQKLEETVARLQQENQEMQVKLVHQQQEPIITNEEMISPVTSPVEVQQPLTPAVIGEEYADAQVGHKRRRQTQTRNGNKRRRGKKSQSPNSTGQGSAGQANDPNVPIPEQPPSTPYGTTPGREPYPSAADVTAMMAKIDEQIEKEDEEMLFAKDEDSDDECDDSQKTCNHDHSHTATPRNGGRGRKTKGAPVQVEGKYKCQWHDCGLLFDKMEDLVEHLSEGHVGHGKSKYACFWGDCNRYGVAFPKRHKLTTHIRSHTGEQPYMCPIPNCGKIFSRKDSMKTHVKTHTHVRQWHCRIRGCKKSYIHKRSLNKHEELHWKSLVEAWKSLGYVMLPSFNQATLQELLPQDLSQQAPAPTTVSPVTVAPSMPILDPQQAASIAAMGLLFPVDPHVASQIQRQKMQTQGQILPAAGEMVASQQYSYQIEMQSAAAAIPPPPQPPPSTYPTPPREQPQYVWTNEILETGQPEHNETKVAREFQFHQHNMY